MATPVGNMTGMPNRTLRSSGAVTPTASPQGQPHRKPHSSTGMCMGQSIAPISGIWPVMKGSASAMARYSAA